MFPKMMPFSVDDILMVALMFSKPWGPSTVGVGFSTRRRSPEQGEEGGTASMVHATPHIRSTVQYVHTPVAGTYTSYKHTHHTSHSIRTYIQIYMNTMSFIRTTHVPPIPHCVRTYVSRFSKYTPPPTPSTSTLTPTIPHSLSPPHSYSHPQTHPPPPPHLPSVASSSVNP